MHEKVYATMLQLYPRDWRREFGVEMAAVFADALHAARRRGALAVIRLWWRELASLPSNILGTISKHDGGRPNLLVAASLMMVIASVVSHLVADAGLFHATSLTMLAAGLAASGFIFGAGRRIAALLLVVLTLGASLAADAIAMRFASSGVTSTLTIPGVRLDLTRLESLPVYGTLIERAAAAGSPRIRTTTFARDGALYLTVVRSGGVDGAYALLTMLLLAGTAWSGWRMSRGPQLVIS